MINLLVNGAQGKMGKNVITATLGKENISAVCGVDKISDFTNPNFPIYDNFESVKEKIDVIVDFSSPLALDGILNYAKSKKINLVLCTTGYTESDLKKIKSASKEIAVFRSANMSLGLNAILDLVKNTAKALYDFDVEIIEKHHNEKKDAPSGTALMLADAIKEVEKDKFYTFGRKGMVGKRDKKEIGIHAIRGGNIVGEHQVIFCGLDETVTITHQATDRKVFAIGAVKASEFISTKKNGLYDMSDMMKA